MRVCVVEFSFKSHWQFFLCVIDALTWMFVQMPTFGISPSNLILISYTVQCTSGLWLGGSSFKGGIWNKGLCTLYNLVKCLYLKNVWKQFPRGNQINQQVAQQISYVVSGVVYSFWGSSMTKFIYKKYFRFGNENLLPLIGQREERFKAGSWLCFSRHRANGSGL